MCTQVCQHGGKSCEIVAEQDPLGSSQADVLHLPLVCRKTSLLGLPSVPKNKLNHESEENVETKENGQARQNDNCLAVK